MPLYYQHFDRNWTQNRKWLTPGPMSWAPKCNATFLMRILSEILIYISISEFEPGSCQSLLKPKFQHICIFNYFPISIQTLHVTTLYKRINKLSRPKSYSSLVILSRRLDALSAHVDIYCSLTLNFIVKTILDEWHY